MTFPPRIKITKEGIAVCYNDHGHSSSECEWEEYVHANFRKPGSFLCLGCGKPLPDVDEMAAKLGKTGDKDIVVCSCETVMVYEVATKKLRSPRVQECRLFIENMLPQVLAKLGKIGPRGKCPGCGTEFHGATAMLPGQASPEPGCLSLCSTCGCVAVYDDKLELRHPTPEEMKTEVFETCLKASAEIQIMLASRRSKENDRPNPL